MHEFLAQTFSEPLDRRFGTLIRRVKGSIRSEETGDDVDDFASFIHILGCFLRDEECGFTVDIEHLVILLLRDLRECLLQDCFDQHDDTLGAPGKPHPCQPC